MLGWEYPPRYAGGLGKACRGLSSAMARQGMQVFFILPSFPERLSEPSLDVIGARECLIEAGWDPGVVDNVVEMRRVRAQQNEKQGYGPEGTAGFETLYNVVRTDATLFPYGVAPGGPTPESIKKIFGDAGTGAGFDDPVPGAEEVVEYQRSVSSGGGGGGKLPKGEKAKATPAPEASKEIYGKNLWSEIEKFTFAVRQMHETHEVDCVHAHDWMTFPAAFEFQRVTGAPVFLHVHATEYDRTGENMHSEVYRIEREGFRRATHIFAVSKYTAGVIERLYGVNKRKISVVYNAPDEGAKEMLAAPEEEREPQVVFLGRLTFQKGPDHFLRAAQLVAKAVPEAKFVYCGTGDMFDQLRAMSHRMGIEDRVHFAGFVSPHEAEEILKRSRVLVMPSVSEPFGLVALEAIHCGIPVIMSKQSGVKEVLHRALQVDFWDHEKLADQMIASLRLKDLSKQLVDEGMEQVRQLSWERSARRVYETYRKYLTSNYARAIGGGHGR